MRYAKIRKQDITNGNGVRVSIFFQGCRFHCKNCFNQSTWNFDGGEELTEEKICELIRYATYPYIKGISILGGEPFQQPADELLEFLKRLKREVNKPIYLWSGYTFEAIPSEYSECLRYIDVLIDGQFKEELKDFNLKWRGSSNQRILHLIDGKIDYIERENN